MQAKRWLAAIVPAVLLTGCATMEGKWSLAKVEPTAARRDFTYESLTLQKDGTFYAEAKKASGVESVSGTWRVTDGVLALEENGGTLHTYDANLDPGGQKLTLASHWEDRRLNAVFEKQEPR
jgi:hypothetical protein